MKSIFKYLGEPYELFNININFERKYKINTKNNKKQSNRHSLEHSSKAKGSRPR